jgi:LacI family transcriptional regulator
MRNSGQSHKKSGSVTIVDVARDIGVSHATVSRVLNAHQGVKPATRQRVLEAVDRLGYVANPQARRLAGGRSHLIGLIISGLTNGYAARMLEGIEAAVSETDYDLLLYSSISRTRRQTHEGKYVERLINGLADGLLIVSPFFPDTYFEQLERHRFPYVLVDHTEPRGRHPAIFATNYQGAYEATEYLIQLGHRRIGFITGWQVHPSSHERLQGYQSALAAHNLVFDPAMVCVGDFLIDGGYQAGRKLLSMPDPPSAIFASSDDMAIGVMNAARQLGRRIPDDVSIMGFDDIHQASHVYPRLTTVSQSLEEIGAIALNMLLEYISNPDSPRRQHMMATRLVIRESCQPPARADQQAAVAAVHAAVQAPDIQRGGDYRE